MTDSVPAGTDGRKAKMTFDFVAPYSLEDCIYRLGKLQEIRDLKFVPRIIIKRRMLDVDTCEFHVRETRPASITLVGYLNRLDDGATYVSGETAIQRRTYVEAAPFVGAIFALCIVVGWGVGALLLPPLFLFMRGYWRGSEVEQDRLLRLTKDMLLY